MQTDIPSMLQYLLSQQGREQPTPEETALAQASQGLPVMVAGGPEDAAKRSWLQRIFGTNKPQQPQTPADAAKPAEGLFSPGSIGDQIRKRREEMDKAGKEASLVPDDYQLAANDVGTRNDAYGGVSMQTRAGMDALGRADPNGEFGDAIINRQQPAATSGYAAKTTVRGPQTSKQEDQLTTMLINRGMDPKKARERARSIK